MSAACILFLAPASAQEPEAPAAAVDAGAASVTAYPPSFFAQFHPFNAMDMIGRLPGFSFDGGSDARGLSGSSGNVLIDGQASPSRTDSLRDVLSRIPARTVERIELVRGGAGGIDMQGKTVIANVIRKKGTGITGAVGAEATASELGELFTNGSLQLQKRSGDRSIEGSLGFTATDGVQRRWRRQTAPDGRLLLRASTRGDVTERGLIATGIFETGLGEGKLRLNTKLEGHLDSSGYTEVLIVPGGANVEDFDGQRRSGELGARYTRRILDGGSLELIASQQLAHFHSTDDYDAPTFSAFTGRNSDAGQSVISGKVKFPAWNAVNFEAGLEGDYNFDNEKSVFVLNDLDLGLDGDVSRGKELRSETFVTATYAPMTKVSLEASLRYEHSTISAKGSAGEVEQTLGFWKPRGVVTWTPNEHHQVVLRAERTVDQLSFDAFSASASFQTGIFNFGNPDIVPPQTWTYEARYEYRFGKRGSVLLILNHEDQHDVLSRVSVAVLDAGGAPVYYDITRNAAEVKQDTLTLTANLPLDDWGLKGGVLTATSNWRDGHLIDPVTGIARGPSNQNANDWNFNLSQNITGSKFSWYVSAFSPRHFYVFNPRVTGEGWSDFRWNTGITYRPDDQWNINVGLNTVTGGSNHLEQTFFTGPRNVGSPAYVELAKGLNRTLAYISIKRTI